MVPLAIAHHGKYQKIFAPLKAHTHLYSIGGQENVDELQKGVDARIMIWWAIVLAQELVMTAFSPCSPCSPPFFFFVDRTISMAPVDVLNTATDSFFFLSFFFCSACFL